MIRNAAIAMTFAAATAIAAQAHADVPLPYNAPNCTTTMMGEPVRPVRFSEATQTRLSQDLLIAEVALAIAPDREDNHIWVGRRLSYLGRYCEAIDAFTRGIAAFPESYKLRRFRAQTLARVRAYDLAIEDYTRAAALSDNARDSYEPDGAPNAINMALGTYRSNIFYYLAQTQFAVGDYAGVVQNMERSLAVMPPHLVAEHQIATTYWRYMALMKQGDARAARRLLARMPNNIEPVEASQYLEAVRFLQGRVREDALQHARDPVVRYAVAMQKRFTGDEAGADAALRAIVADTANGYWPAEVEIATPDRRR